MTPLDIIRDAYKRAGIHYAEKLFEGTWFVKRCSERDLAEFHTWTLHDFTHGEFMEFDEDGSLMSY